MATTTTERLEKRPPARATSVDAWMATETRFLGRDVKRQTLWLWALRIPAFVPVFFMSPAIVTLNSAVFSGVEADVLGTGTMMLLMLTLLITPLSTITRQRWFVPLRRWYGVMMAVTAFTDATAASITTNFAGGVFGRLAGHSFLLVGFLMIVLLIPLFLTGNNFAQRRLGRYWKVLHKLTYVIWGLLFLHLALLEGLGFQHGTNGPSNAVDGNPIMHQRLYQLTGCSILLLVFRLPKVKRWVAEKQRAGQEWKVYLTVVPLAVLFVLAFSFMLNEEITKGTGAFTLHAEDD
jgi:DMSO/TMAO reductase YedYZ heme-binding membrane subunit